MARSITYREAINEAIAQEMARDERVIVMGEDNAGGQGSPGEDDAWGGVLGVTKEEMAALQKLNPGFVPYTLKAGLYKDQGVTEAVQTFQSPTVLIASSSTSPEVIYKITKAIACRFFTASALDDTGP